jgi:ribosomal-protein-alanine N-acetyltransferase
VLRGRRVTLRELRGSDAASLHALLTTEAVARFISTPPTTVEGFERFIAWTHRQRAAGGCVCFAVTARGLDAAIGVIQIRQLGAGFGTAEWGFAMGPAFWGSGVFQESAELALGFGFDTLGIHRLEARAALLNGRGNGALLKLGAVQEGVLRRSFLCFGEYLDQALYAILEADWRAAQRPREPAAARMHWDCARQEVARLSACDVAPGSTTGRRGGVDVPPKSRRIRSASRAPGARFKIDWPRG